MLFTTAQASLLGFVRVILAVSVSQMVTLVSGVGLPSFPICNDRLEPVRR